MTKRPHPDGSSADISPMQLKTRVGERQVNEGVNAEENMKKVYDKTLSMMMEGAREQAKHEKEEEMACEEAEKEEKAESEEKAEEEEQKVEPGQMYLNTKGDLAVAGVYVAVPEEEGEKKEDKMEENGGGDSKKETDEKMEEGESKENGSGDAKKDETKDSGAKTEDGESKKEENGKSENGDGENDENQPSLEQFGFIVDGPCTHTSPLKAARLSPATSPAKSPYKLEKRPLNLDEKMEEDKSETKS
ncbi:uncharacterized protein LOC135484918 [Lineus longissimus]|uniref:uncharacterized protein LOC135484918 n=1 Tax=Lineus longissimus TaxID=88925 RepID=UPI002B4E5B76